MAFSDEQLTHLRQQLGVADDADEATILAALDQTLAEYVDPAKKRPAPAVPEGHVVVPEARLADLEAAAQLGVAAAKELRDKERDDFLDSVRTKFLPKNRQAWADEYDRNPEATREHFAKAPEIVPVNQIGNGGAADLDTEDERAYRALFGEEVNA